MWTLEPRKEMWEDQGKNSLITSKFVNAKLMVVVPPRLGPTNTMGLFTLVFQVYVHKEILEISTKNQCKNH